MFKTCERITACYSLPTCETPFTFGVLCCNCWCFRNSFPAMTWWIHPIFCVQSIGNPVSYVLGSKLPSFPYRTGCHQPNNRGLYTHFKDSLLKVGWVYPQYKELIDPGTYVSKWLAITNGIRTTLQTCCIRPWSLETLMMVMVHQRILMVGECTCSCCCCCCCCCCWWWWWWWWWWSSCCCLFFGDVMVDVQTDNPTWKISSCAVLCDMGDIYIYILPQLAGAAEDHQTVESSRGNNHHGDS